MEPPRPQELDPHCAQDFRQALGRFASGVVVVSAIGAQGRPVGMTCQSFSSLSLDPPLVMFCPGEGSTTFPGLRKAGSLCINVLGEHQSALSGQFARSGTDKWRDVTWTAGRNGAPRLHGAILWCEGDIVHEYPGGDHRIVLVRPTALAISQRSAPPLLFYEGRYAAVHPVSAR